MPQRRVDTFQLRKVKLSYLRLVGKRERLIQQLRVQPRLAELLEQLLRQHRVHVPDTNSLAIELLQEFFDFIRQERLLDGTLQLRVLLRLLNLDGSLFKNHCHPLLSDPSQTALGLSAAGSRPAKRL